MPEMHVPPLNGEDEELIGGDLSDDGEALEVPSFTSEEPLSLADPQEEEEEEISFDESPHFAPVPSFTPPKRRRGRPRKTFDDRRLEKRAENIEQSFEDLLSGLEFNDGQHKITVYREEPQHDLISGQRIAGLLHTFTHPVTIDEVQKRFGGGIYRIMVRGPRAVGRGSIVKANKRVEIAGNPLPMPDPNARKKDSDGAIDLMKSYLESKDNEMSEMRSEMKESQNFALQALLQRNDDNPALSQLMMQMKEDQRRQEERRREERTDRQRQIELQERRHREEKEENEKRAREDREADNRRYEQSREEARMRHERDMLQFQQQQDSSSKAQENMFTMMMKLQLDQEKKTADSSANNLGLVQEFQAAQMNQMQNNYEMMFQMSQAQVQEAREAKRQNDDFSSTVSKLSQLREAASLFDPSSSPDDRPGWERVMDKLGDALPGMMGAASALRGGTALPPEAMGAPRPQIAPGSVALVPPNHIPQPPNISPPLESGPEPDPSPPSLSPPSEPVMEMEATPSDREETAEDPVNPYTEYVPFNADIPPDISIQVLVQNIDFGISQNHPIDLIFEKTVAPLDETIKGAFKDLGEDGLITFIENNVPVTWSINSLQGEDTIRALYSKLG